MDILQTDDIQQLKKLAKTMGVKVDSGDDLDRIKVKIASMLGDLGYADTNVSDDMKEKARASAINQIMNGTAELGGLSDYPTDLKPGKLPNLLPFQNPWGGRRRRIRRERRSENDQQILFLTWNGYPYILGLEAEYADVPYPHILTCLDLATTDKLKQRKAVNDEGQAVYVDKWYTVHNFPYRDLGVTPGTEHLPRSMKEYIYRAYVEGFPDFTPIMWKQIAQAYSWSDKRLGITPTMGVTTQVKTRRMAVLNQLNIMDVGDTQKRRDERVEIIAEILVESPIAEAA